MIVISKKRIQIIVTGLIIAIFAFSFQVANNKNETKDQTIQTTSTPVSGKTIIIDARTWNSRETELLINPKNKRGMIEIL